LELRRGAVGIEQSVDGCQSVSNHFTLKLCDMNEGAWLISEGPLETITELHHIKRNSMAQSRHQV
jgi:hypothetical protein